MTDGELVNMFNSGDKNAFNELYEKYANQAVRTAFLITHNKALSDDIVQESFIKCYVGLKNIKNPEFFRSWFFKILVRTAWEMDNKNKYDIPVDEIFDRVEMALNNEEPKDDFNFLYDAVNALGKKQKTVVVLFYFNDMSISEISKITGFLNSTVKSQLFLARKNIKKYIEKTKKKGGLLVNEI